MARIAIIPGDGIGPDVIAEGIKVLEAVGRVTAARLDLVHFDLGAERYLRTGETLARRLCPLKNRSEGDVDFVVFRENTEGLYVGVGGFFKKGTADEVAVQEDVNTRKGVERIIEYAFRFAHETKRTKVTMSDKANVLTYGHDLWQRVFHEVGARYPDIEAEHLYVDALAMQLVRAPQRFRVIVTCNMFGDILTDLGAALQGGLGRAASGNLNPERTPLFEPVHGSAPK